MQRMGTDLTKQALAFCMEALTDRTTSLTSSQGSQLADEDHAWSGYG